jgi:hypothetical protein
MATLSEDRIIQYTSEAEFLDQYDSHILQGGFYLESPAEWPLRTTVELSVRIGTTDTGVRIEAEVVYCGQGKVGLQIAPDSNDTAAMAELAEQLRGGPILTDDGVVNYGSVTAFLADFEANVATGGFYATATGDWQVGELAQFSLHIGGVDSDLPFMAKTVMSQSGMVSLQIEPTRENISAINGLVVRLRKQRKQEIGSLAAKRREQEQEKERAKDKAREKAKSREEDLHGRGPVLHAFQGIATASRDKEEFKSIRPVQFGDQDGQTTTLFELIATLTAACQPSRLLVESNGDRMTFRFNANGELCEFEGPRSEVDFLKRLSRAHFIDEGIADELRSQLGGTRKASELALAQGVVTAHQVSIVFRDQVIDALEKCRSRGQVRFLLDLEPVESEGGLRFEKMIMHWMERALTALEAAKVKTMLRPIWDGAPRLCREPLFTLSQLDLDDHCHRFAQRFDGSLTLKKSLAGMDKKLRDKSVRLVLSLLALGTLEVDSSNEPRKEKPQRARDEAPAPATRETTPDADQAGELEEELARLEECGLFDRLGVHWSAHPRMFVTAMQEMSRHFGPSGELAQSSARLAELCQRRLQMAKQAFEVLTNPQRRMEQRGIEVSVAMRSQSAKLMFGKAEQKLNLQEISEAVELLEMAVELDPRPEYTTKLATVRRYYKK